MTYGLLDLLRDLVTAVGLVVGLFLLLLGAMVLAGWVKLALEEKAGTR